MLTGVPPVVGPSSGVTSLTPGAATYVNVGAAEPPWLSRSGVVTITGTRPATCAGETAVIVLAEFTVNAASVPPNSTLLACARRVPVIVTLVPPATGPALGLTSPRSGIVAGSANTQTAPAPSLSPRPPMSAVVPSCERATLWPKRPSGVSSAPASFEPCCLYVPDSERANTQAAPMKPLSPGAPIRTWPPSPDTATLRPKKLAPCASAPPVSFGCRSHDELPRVKAQAAPPPPPSAGAPIPAVLPSPDSATLRPKCPSTPSSSPPVSVD